MQILAHLKGQNGFDNKQRTKQQLKDDCHNGSLSISGVWRDIGGADNAKIGVRVGTKGSR